MSKDVEKLSFSKNVWIVKIARFKPDVMDAGGQLGIEIFEDVGGVVRLAEEVGDLVDRVRMIPGGPPLGVGDEPLLLRHRIEGGFQNFHENIHIHFLNGRVNALVVDRMNGVALLFEDFPQDAVIPFQTYTIVKDWYKD